eukprot:g2004.t1
MFCRNIEGTGLRIRWTSLPANTTNLARITAEPFRVLHLSGHGEAGKFIFEHKGKAHYLSGDEIVKFTKEASKWLKLVVISACDSKAIGQRFFSMGIPYVVAVQSNQAVMDQACIEMTTVFYHHLFNGQTVVRSFNQGKLACKHHADIGRSNEDEKFILYRACDSSDASIFDGIPKGAPVRRLSKMSTHNIWKVPTNIYIGRQQEMQTLYQTITSARKHPVVVLTGPVGIGKGTLALKTISYISRRNHFDEAYFVDLSERCRRRNLLEELILQTDRVLFPASTSESEDSRLVAFFSECQALMQDKRVLIVFNHLEVHLQCGEARDLNIFMQHLLNASNSRIKMLLLSVTYPINFRVPHVRVGPLRPLSDREASEMFLKLLPVKPRRSEVSSIEQFATTEIIRRMKGLPGLVEAIAVLYTEETNLGNHPMLGLHCRGLVSPIFCAQIAIHASRKPCVHVPSFVTI